MYKTNKITEAQINQIRGTTSLILYKKEPCAKTPAFHFTKKQAIIAICHTFFSLIFRKMSKFANIVGVVKK